MRECPESCCIKWKNLSRGIQGQASPWEKKSCPSSLQLSKYFWGLVFLRLRLAGRSNLYSHQPAIYWRGKNSEVPRDYLASTMGWLMLSRFSKYRDRSSCINLNAAFASPPKTLGRHASPKSIPDRTLATLEDRVCGISRKKKIPVSQTTKLTVASRSLWYTIGSY